MRTQVVALVLQARQSPTNASNGQDNEEDTKNAHIPPLFKTRQAGIVDQMEGIKMEGIDEVDEEVKAASELRAARCPRRQAICCRGRSRAVPRLPHARSSPGSTIRAPSKTG